LLAESFSDGAIHFMIVYVSVFGMSDVRSRCREFALGDPEGKLGLQTLSASHNIKETVRRIKEKQARRWLRDRQNGGPLIS
jgi:hypothetical protein